MRSNDKLQTLHVQIALIAYDHEDDWSKYSTGIWSGAVAAVAGAVGVCAARAPSPGRLVTLMVLASCSLLTAGACCVVAVLAMRDTCDFSLQEVGCRTYSILHFAIALVAGLELPFGMVLFIIGSSGYCCGKENGKQRCQKA